MDEIPLSQPSINERDIDLVTNVLRSGRLALGPMAARFEEALASRVGKRRGVAVSSGTAGLHLALLAMGVGPGDEVITTSFSFIAPANAILYVGAKPVLVDVCPRTLNADPKLIDQAVTPNTKAIIAVENFGNPSYMDEYRRIADKHEIKLIEDACEGIGGTYRNRPIGSFGHAAIFAFYPNKQITTGEGGVVVTDDDHLADAIESLRNHGRPTAADGHNITGNWMQFARLGFNYRLSEIHAALGVSQLERLDTILRQRREAAELYTDRLLDNTALVVPSPDEDTIMSWFVYVVRLNDQYGAEERDRVIAGMRRHDVGCAPYFPCVHLQPQFRELGYAEGDFPIAESVSQRTLALPFYTDVTDRDIDYACRTLALMIERENLTRS